MASEALALHIEGMVEDGEDIPPPATLDAVTDDPAMHGAVAFLVNIEPPGDKTVRVNIAARESQVEKIDARAKRFGLSRSAYLIQAGLGQLAKNPRSRARSLPPGAEFHTYRKARRPQATSWQAPGRPPR